MGWSASMTTMMIVSVTGWCCSLLSLSYGNSRHTHSRQTQLNGVWWGFQRNFNSLGFLSTPLFLTKACFFGAVLVAVFSRLIHTKAYVVVPLWLRSLKNGSQWCLVFTDSLGLGVCHGCLRICQILVQSHVGIWELKDYDNEGGGKWCLEHKVSVNQFV